MDESTPRLKCFGVLIVLGIVLQLMSLVSPWFTLENTEFSIRGLSSTYLIEVITKECSTMEKNSEILCFCPNHCETFSKIYNQGWACSILLILSINLLLAEIFVIRRKIWRLEGIAIPNSVIDRDFILISGILVQNFGVFFWVFSVYKYPGVYFSSGLSFSLLACLVNLIGVLHYCVKIKPNIRVL